MKNKIKTIRVTGIAIIGIDNMNDYYDVSIKEYRLKQIEACVAEHSDSTWHFIKGSIADKAFIDECFAKYQPENLLDFVDILQQELIRAGVLPEDYDFEAHKELVSMQPGDVPVTFVKDSSRVELR